MSARRSRVRRVAKWAGVIVCLVIILAAAACVRWKYIIAAPSVNWVINIRDGCVAIVWSGLNRPISKRGFSLGPRHTLIHGVAKWWTSRALWPSLAAHDPFGGYVPHGGSLGVPLWMLFVLIGLPTAFLWYRDRRFRFPPGHCASCGYNLHGLTEPRCPECGTGFGGGG